MKSKKPPQKPPPAISPFSVLAQLDLPRSPTSASDAEDAETAGTKTRAKDRGRLDIQRSTAHRGGKTVTVIKGFDGLARADIEQLAKALQKACGAGGTVKNGTIEIQGDQRNTALRILAAAGFRPVLAGG